MHYSKTFYYKLAVVVNGDESLSNVGERDVLKQISWALSGARKVKIDEQEIEIRPIAVDLLPKTKEQTLEDLLGRLNLLVEKVEAVPKSESRVLLAKLNIWANNAIKKHGALDVLGYLKQYIEELGSRT